MSNENRYLRGTTCKTPEIRDSYSENLKQTNETNVFLGKPQVKTDLSGCRQICTIQIRAKGYVNNYILWGC